MSEAIMKKITGNAKDAGKAETSLGQKRTAQAVEPAASGMSTQGVLRTIQKVKQGSDETYSDGDLAGQPGNALMGENSDLSVRQNDGRNSTGIDSTDRFVNGSNGRKSGQSGWRKGHVVKQTGRSGRRVSGFTGLYALFRKEMADHLRSRRFLIMLLLIGGTSYASLYGAVSELSETTSDYMFLELYTSSGSSIPSFMSFIALLGPIVGLALGFDAINSERQANTLNRLVAQPIYRDSIIIGKFLAGTAVIAIVIYTMGIMLGALGVLATGLTPDGEEVMRIFFFLTFTVIYIAFWLALAILFSVVCRHSATSALVTIALWIFFSIFMSLLATIIAGAVYPINTYYGQMFNQVKYYTLKLNLNRISPYYLYSEAVATIMNPSVRSVNVVTTSQLVGAISSYLSLGQSLLLVWPHLVGMIAEMIAAFGCSYIGFMRQEIRTN